MRVGLAVLLSSVAGAFACASDDSATRQAFAKQLDDLTAAQGAFLQQRLGSTASNKKQLRGQVPIGMQNKPTGVCEDMCQLVKAYPQCAMCKDFKYDATPDHMTWDELFDKMEALKQDGKEQLRKWDKEAAQHTPSL